VKSSNNGEAKQNFHALQLLSQQRFEHLSVPVPILYDEDTQMLLTTEVKGNKCEGLKPIYLREQLHRIGRA